MEDCGRAVTNEGFELVVRDLIRIRVTRPKHIALVCRLRLDVYSIFHALSPRNSEDETEPFQANVQVIF